MDFDPPKETGPEVDVAAGNLRGSIPHLWTHDRAVLAEYGRFNAAMKKGSET